MSDKELKESIKAMKKLQKKHKDSPKEALAFLVRAGIATANGKLKKPYQQGA